MTELQGKPASAASWVDVGSQHREFFRVKAAVGQKKAHVSLIARNVQDAVERDDGDELRPLLSAETTAKLMELAVDLHAKQVQRSEAWKTVLIPILIAVLAAIASISAAFISVALKAPSTTSAVAERTDSHPQLSSTK
ncbi:hypothetical protein ACSFBM_15560 [Variovorax sp. GB1R11]|uniref:hypothetical protein n=1 Tax=Variovorax sp. GB1R11 TaxID=3443741 RepID=UPI003F44EB50